MRRAEERELALGPRQPGATLQRWLYTELREAILSGRIAPGRLMPATRDLARQQGVSRGTVLAVYEQLIAEGYLGGTRGSGTVVLDGLPIPPVGTATPQRKYATRPRLSRQGELLAASPFMSHEGATTARPFSPNQPDLRSFPLTIWQRITNRHSHSISPETLSYGDPAGFLPLRKAIAEHLRYSQRIDCHAGQVMILGGAQQALDLCARLLLEAGDSALVEDPGYPGAARIFELAGAQVLGWPVDLEGLRTDLPLPEDDRTRLAYVTAAHQSPLGGTLPLARRLALLAWAEERNAVIIEDDYDGEYRYDAAPLPALKSLDQHGRVIYLGTFSKLLFPSLRLAYLVVPDWLADACTSAISLTCRHAPIFAQAVLAEFIAEGHFARHLRHMRLLYGERAACFAQTCAQHLAGLLNVMPITTGLDATAILPRDADDSTVARLLVQGGIEARAVSFYRLHQPAPPALVMGFSAFSTEEITRGVKHMQPLLESALTNTPADPPHSTMP